MSEEKSAKMPNMRLERAERSEPKELFPCSMCITKTKVYRRYRFVLQAIKGSKRHTVYRALLTYSKGRKENYEKKLMQRQDMLSWEAKLVNEKEPNANTQTKLSTIHVPAATKRSVKASGEEKNGE